MKNSIKFDYDAFINYDRKDIKSAKRLSDELEQIGFRVWFDQNSIFGGEDWEGSIKNAILNSKYFINLQSSRSIENSGYVRKEIEYAQETLKKRPTTKIFILPIRLDECHTPIIELRKTQWIDLFPDWGNGFRKLIKILNNEKLSGKDIEIIGFDLGHGETSITRTSLLSKREPIAVDIINGKKTILTTVALHPKRGVLIGDDAFDAFDPIKMHIFFKSRHLELLEVAEPMKIFIQKCLQCIINNGSIVCDNDTMFIVGSPSGWDEKDRALYESIFKDAGIKNVTVCPESRAAFLEAKESGALPEENEELYASVLIIDIGSSTTDFTIVKNYKEKPIDFGHNQLGAGLIDKIIYNRVIENDQIIKNFLEKNTLLQPRCLLICRYAKEIYFSKEREKDLTESPASSYEKLSKGIFFEVELYRRDMEEILSTPIKELNNSSWQDAFRGQLKDCLLKLENDQPNLVLLAGGGSRMRFVKRICQEEFNKAKVQVNHEPSLTIAMGLAIAGRIDYRVKAFLEEADTFLFSDTIPNIIQESLPKFIANVSNTFYLQVINHTKRGHKKWILGEIQTINELERIIEINVKNDFELNGYKYFKKDITCWLQLVSEKIEKQTIYICDRYNIDRASFSLNISSLKFSGITVVDPSEAVQHALTNAIIIISRVIYIVGIGIGLAVFNLAGVIAIAVKLLGMAGLLAIKESSENILSKDRAKKFINEYDVPVSLRGVIFSEDRLIKEFDNRKEEIKNEVSLAIQNELESGKKIDEIIYNIRCELKRKANEAAVLIS